MLVGTGGQGVLTAARLLCRAFVAQGRDVVSGQLHGMAQRGGSVQSSVVVDGGLSPVIGEGRADLVVGFEPVETARALPFMWSGAVVYMNTTPVVPFILGQQSVLKKVEAKYPDVEELTEGIAAVAAEVFPFDAWQLAQEAGSAKALNMVMLGCLMGSGSLPCTVDEFWNTAAKEMPARLAEINSRAFLNGVEVGKVMQCGEPKP